jgi:KAP P-loop domain-containing protein
MKELTDKQILRHLRNNTILRNNQLSMLVKLLNSLKESTVLAIDGSWGSGKTVFVKQLLMLSDSAIQDYGHNTLDEPAINLLREKQKTFYFNAWEYDYLGDALSAMLLKLIADDDESLTQGSIKKALSMINISAGLKNLTHDFIDIDNKTGKADLVKAVKDQVNRHDAVNEFLNKLKGDSERLIFVIDELDRCRPSFAVELLEVVKHYFMRDDVTFIITTNVNQLSHTIKKYYGSDFDGYAYLNKFFDFIFSLRKVNSEDYTRSVLDWYVDSSVVDGVARDAIEYYGFEMREINSYYSSLQLVSRFLARNNNWRKDQYPTQLVFVPLALALKVKKDSLYEQFTSGKGEGVLRDFVANSYSALGHAERLVNEDRSSLSQEQIKEMAVDALIVEYKNIFASEGRGRSGENLQDFHEAIALIGSYTTISVEGDGQ